MPNRSQPTPKALGPYFVNGQLVMLKRGKPRRYPLSVPVSGEPLYMGTLKDIERNAPYPETAISPVWPGRKPGHRWA